MTTFHDEVTPAEASPPAKQVAARAVDHALAAHEAVGRLAAELSDFRRDVRKAFDGVHERLDEIAPQVEDTGRFVIDEKKARARRRRRFYRVAMAVALGAAGALGAAAAGATWHACATAAATTEGHR